MNSGRAAGSEAHRSAVVGLHTIDRAPAADSEAFGIRCVFQYCEDAGVDGAVRKEAGGVQVVLRRDGAEDGGDVVSGGNADWIVGVPDRVVMESVGSDGDRAAGE